MTAILRMENITKIFPGVVANDGVTLEIEQGEIHALLGENGAGKTTCMNILYGLYRPNSGRITFRGEEIHIHSSKDAINLGIGMVHQHFMLVPTLTVVENIVLGLPSRREPLLDLEKAKAEIARLSKSYGLEVDPIALVWDLSVGMQQRVEIIKALYRGADLLILDEPTSVLTPAEVRDLFLILQRLAHDGHSIIFITHKLDEVMEISDRVTVLRDGRVVATVHTAETSKAALARMMVGREVLFRLDKPPVEPGKTVLEVRNLNVPSSRYLSALKNVSLGIRRGEILGIAGVDGNGQSELAESICGLRRPTSGHIFILGQEVTNHSPRELFELNLAHIPEDRQKVGLVMDFTITENIIIKNFYRQPFSERGFLHVPTILQQAERLVKEYDIRAPNTGVKVRALSGGNQQKVVLARELCTDPDLLVAVQPTRGLDVGATEYVERRLLEQRSRGAAILYISTELEEILSLSDRIAVLYGGEIMGIVPAAAANIEDIGLMMAGSKKVA
ncbi:MAG: ABC transporter ATP-binding protein [Chloroflexi bacterium]|nr:ABC transporter ATP-binding protein [Chloroflexota bacterium]MCL5075372.1 ABC transporter ATP-binding protein [Chloroflexota bacterium]